MKFILIHSGPVLIFEATKSMYDRNHNGPTFQVPAMQTKRDISQCGENFTTVRSLYNDPPETFLRYSVLKIQISDVESNLWKCEHMKFRYYACTTSAVISLKILFWREPVPYNQSKYEKSERGFMIYLQNCITFEGLHQIG